MASILKSQVKDLAGWGKLLRIRDPGALGPFGHLRASLGEL
jgi:hypothetical protein